MLFLANWLDRDLETIHDYALLKVMKQWAKQSGFTIVELLIVVVVIAILAAITIVAYSGIQQRAREQVVRSDLQSLQKAMLMYREEKRVLPPGADFYSGSSMPPTANWASVVNTMKSGGYISTSGLELDPWGRYYWYDNNDCSIGQGGYSPLKSVGPDGLLNTADDIGITIVTAC